MDRTASFRKQPGTPLESTVETGRDLVDSAAWTGPASKQRNSRTRHQSTLEPSIDFRERLVSQGVHQLEDFELLGLILRSGNPQLGIQALSKGLLSRHSLPILARMPLSELQEMAGLGPAKASSLLAAFELGRRTVQQSDSSLTTLQLAKSWFTDLTLASVEQFRVLALNARKQVVAVETVSKGTLTQTLVHPREVFRFAIKCNAAAVLVGHNHPSGDPSPSQDDIVLTRRLREAGALLGIELVDHVIVSSGGYRSLSASLGSAA
jgi:DNA repair protein RadC